MAKLVKSGSEEDETLTKKLKFRNKMKIRFCPKCKSTKVQRNMTAISGALGSMADWICNKCNFTYAEFPEKEFIKKGKVEKK